MKNLALVLAVAVTSTGAFARYAGPYLTVSKGPGFVMPADAQGSTCSIFADRVEITRTHYAQQLNSVETRKLKMELAPLTKAISGAAAGKVEKVVGPVDGPTAEYAALEIQPNDAVKKVILFTDGNFENLVNTSEEGKALKNFIDAHCE